MTHADEVRFWKKEVLVTGIVISSPLCDLTAPKATLGSCIAFLYKYKGEEKAHVTDLFPPTFTHTFSKPYCYV